MVIVLLLIGGAALFARGMGDDDDDGGGNGGGGGNGSDSHDDGDGDATGGGQAVGDNCEADLPPELSLVECGYSVTTQGEGMTFQSASVGYVVENVSGETITVGGIDLEGADTGGDPVTLTGLSSPGVLHPGQRIALGGSGTLPSEGDGLDFVMISGDNALINRPLPETVPLGELSVSNISADSGVEVGMGEEGTRISYTLTSRMDRRVNATAHVLLRNDQGAIVGYANETLVLEDGQSVDREIEVPVPNVADVEIYATTMTALE